MVTLPASRAFTGRANPSQVHHLPSMRRMHTLSFPKELPSGDVWLSRESTNHDVIYGQTFVLQRPKHGGPGLELCTKATGLSCQPKASSSHLTVQEKRSSRVVMPTKISWDVTDITDYTVLGESGLLPGVPTPFLLPGEVMHITPAAPSTCTQMILHPLVEREPEEEDKNPRRTKKVKFTCNMCNATSIKRVSPRGWNAGTVLAKCDGCGRVHKLIDNLKVFHELKGNVYPSRIPKGFQMPKGLPQKPSMTHHVHPAVYQCLPRNAQRVCELLGYIAKVA